MSYFDDASLVMIPSGYKDQKVYSVKPLDGSGDLTFSRASSATRVASNGLIEKVRTNLALQSQNFTTTWLTNASPTITANTTVAPDGTTTADTIAATGSFSGVYQSPVNVSNGVEYSWSVYIKNISSASNIFLGIASNPSNASLNYNATSGTITSSGAGLVASSATNVGNGWYRLSGTYVTTGTTNDFVIYGMGTMSFAVWGAQLETGVTTDYIATTSAAVSVGPVSGLPRLDYLNSTCPRLLLEPQRSNLNTFSEQLDNAAWNKTNVSVTANTSVSPDGYTNADTITGNGGGSVHDIWQAWNGGTTNSVSCFVKRGTSRYIYIATSFAATTGDYATIIVDLDTQSVVNTSLGNVGFTSARVVNYGNGWYRVTSNTTSTSAVQMYSFFGVSTNNTINLSLFGRQVSPSAETAIFWGMQSEASAAYATSYIPTLGTSVTRVADAASKTGISSLIGQTEGTLFIEANVASGFDGNNLFITASDGTSSNMIFINRVAGRAEYYVETGGTQQATFSTASVLTTGVHKLAVAYKQNDFAFYVDGVLLHSDTNGSVPAMNRINLGSYVAGALPYNDGIKQAILFPTRLTNAQLAELTTL